MASLLYRLGRFSYLRRRLVAGIWALLVVVVGIGAATLSGPTSDSFSIPGTESQEALDLLEERFPELQADGASARVVMAAPDGETLTDPENTQAMADIVVGLSEVPGVAEVADPAITGTISADGRVAIADVRFDMVFPIPAESREGLLDAQAAGQGTGLTVEIGGDALEAEPALGSAEAIGVGVAAVVLVVTFGSLVAAGLPLITALVGVGAAIGLITIATGFLDVGSTTPILATMLGLAVAIDYALFIVSRYRAELSLRDHSSEEDRAEAAAFAVGTAGSAVVFAGATVTIGLAALSVVGLPLLTQMGVAAAIAVVIAVLIALTLLPALMGFAGRRVHSARTRGNGKPTPARRWARFAARRRWLVGLAAIAALAAATAPVADLRMTLPDEGSYAESFTQRKAYDLVSDSFGPGFNGPLMIVVDAGDADDPAGSFATAADEIAALDGIAFTAPPVPNESGDTAVISVVPDSAPASEATETLVDDIRDVDPDGGADVLVTGYTAIMVDFSDRVSEALIPYLAIVAGLSLVLLMIVFRSVAVPLVAAGGFLLTMGTTFGLLVAVFQWGWLADLFGIGQTIPVISVLPIFLVGVVFGLAMDYQVFLVTRMREAYVHGDTPKEAVVDGFTHGAKVVAAAAIIMVSVFGAFITAEDLMLKQIGFALAVAVAVDAFIVRMTLMPAVMSLLDRRAWWLPRWLDRIVPNVDVEGAGLERALHRDVAGPTDGDEREPAMTR